MRSRLRDFDLLSERRERRSREDRRRSLRSRGERLRSFDERRGERLRSFDECDLDDRRPRSLRWREELRSRRSRLRREPLFSRRESSFLSSCLLAPLRSLAACCGS